MCRADLSGASGADLHHLVEVSEGGGNEAGNLLALCPTCHAMYTRGDITPDAMSVYKGALEVLPGLTIKRPLTDFCSSPRSLEIPSAFRGMASSNTATSSRATW
jgi:hypothetical protein